MTKKEAIKILNWIPTKGDEVDAMEMAIEALSIDIVRCKDCVHRVWCCAEIYGARDADKMIIAVSESEVKQMSKLLPDNIADVVMALIGNVEPVGETTVDEKAYENLLCLEETLDILHDEIQFLLPNLNRYEYSMKKQGEEAKKYFESLAESISEWMEEYKDGDSDED